MAADTEVRFALKIVMPLVIALDNAGIVSADDYARLITAGVKDEGDQVLKELVEAFAKALLERNDPAFTPTVIDGGKDKR